ncbi:hypothetical protein GALL_504040 [mine drainage metagenome]|uniref:Uncharacterized protein n=1 Tax=mine drainage metagenome TaxID=410659 RepID=A0A1J5P8T1_9ZZZZ
MIACEAKCALRLLVTHDPNIRGVPLAMPGIEMRLRGGRKATRARCRKMTQSRLTWVNTVTRREDSNDTI